MFSGGGGVGWGGVGWGGWKVIVEIIQNKHHYYCIIF